MAVGMTKGKGQGCHHPSDALQSAEPSMWLISFVHSSVFFVYTSCVFTWERQRGIFRLAVRL